MGEVYRSGRFEPMSYDRFMSMVDAVVEGKLDPNAVDIGMVSLQGGANPGQPAHVKLFLDFARRYGKESVLRLAKPQERLDGMV